jgi:hypothetical protein
MDNQDNKGLDRNELYIEELGEVTGGALRLPPVLTTGLAEGLPHQPPPISFLLSEGVPNPFPLPPKPTTRSLFEDIQRWLPLPRVGT